MVGKLTDKSWWNCNQDEIFVQLNLTCFQENDFILRQTEPCSHLRHFQLFYSFTCTAQLVSCIKTSFTNCSQNTANVEVFIVVSLALLQQL